MTHHSVTHGSFTVERVFPSPRERVFAAWASQAAKDQWFGSGDDFLAPTTRYTLDFRVGGHEVLEGRLPNGKAFAYDAFLQDIVEGRRIVASYDVRTDGQRDSVSLMTVEFLDDATGTRVVITEQGAFLDGRDSNEQRQEGALDSMDKLGAHLRTSAEAGVVPGA